MLERWGCVLRNVENLSTLEVVEEVLFQLAFWDICQLFNITVRLLKEYNIKHNLMFYTLECK